MGELIGGAEICGQRIKLGLAEHQGELTPEFFHPALQFMRRHRGHGVDRQTQARHVTRHRIEGVEHGAIHHRQGEGHGEPLPLDQRDQAIGVEASLDEDRGTDRDRRGGNRVQLRGMEQRQQGADTICCRKPGLQR